jgi:hypothetical protein
MSDSTSKISAALVRAQKAFQPALKTSTNPHFRSKYADLGNCVEAVIEALNAEDIFLMQRTGIRDGGVVVSTVFIHSSGESIDAGELFCPAAKSDPQGYGASLTYARRYSLMAACGHAPEDDDGNYATKAMTQATATAKATQEVDESFVMSARFSECETLDDLKNLWTSLTQAQQKRYAATKDAAKKRIEGAK